MGISRLVGWGALAALLATTGAASAETYSYSNWGVLGQVVTITGPNSVTGYASQIKLTGPDGTVLAWCVDTADDLKQSGTYTVLPSSALETALPGIPNGGLSWTQIGEIGWLKKSGDDYISNVSADANVAAAYALAIWTVEYGDSFKYNDPGQPIDGYVSDLLGDINTEHYTPFYGFRVLEASGGNQTLITDSIPEPSTWAMMAVGLAGLGLAGSRSLRPKPRAAR